MSNQCILVTGAAGRIGFQTSKNLLESGATVILTDLRQTDLDLAVSRIPAMYREMAHTIVADITCPSSVDNLINLSSRFESQIDGLANCAYPRLSSAELSFDSLQKDALSQDLSIQLVSAIIISQKIIKFFLQQGFGNLVHISSIQGIAAPKFDHYFDTNMSSSIGYTATKSAIIGVTKWLAKYTANNNIRVNCVSPGGIEDDQPDIFKERYRNSCTNIGLLSPNDVASVIIFLLSNSSHGINGQNIVVDDGWSL